MAAVARLQQGATAAATTLLKVMLDQTQACLQLIVVDAGATFAMDIDRCVEILAESGFLRNGAGISTADLWTFHTV
jgi:hypothetical protein